MLTAHHLSKSFGHQTLFENVTFSMNPGERLGLIGPNGCGKTTLLRILVGEEQPDSGHVSRDPDLRIGYLPQGFEPDPHATLGEVIGRAAGDAAALEGELAAVAGQLTVHPQDSDLQKRYDLLLSQIQSAESGRTAAILTGLGLDGLEPSHPVAHLSGGQKTRLSLALVLLSEPQLLLLDEPTNHLDITMLEWLEGWLNTYPGAALIVSHDRTFLDRTVRGILDMELKRKNGEVVVILREYAGNYSAYLEQRQAEIERQWQGYNDQQMEIRRMKRDIARTKEQAMRTEREGSSIRIGGPDMKIKGAKDYQHHVAKKIARKARARETRLERYIESDERVERPERFREMHLQFGASSHLSQRAIHLERLSVGYDSAVPLLVDLNLTLRAGERVVLTGPNGSGKTTLLRTIAGQLPALSGEARLAPSLRLGYMSQDQSGLDPDKTPVETMQASFRNETEVRTFLSYFLFVGDEPLKPVSMLSYGQRARLMLAQLVAQGCTCLLMDEPVNHLDIPSRAHFEQALDGFEGAVLAVVHDRYFIERFADEVWWVEQGGIRREAVRVD